MSEPSNPVAPAVVPDPSSIPGPVPAPPATPAPTPAKTESGASEKVSPTLLTRDQHVLIPQADGQEVSVSLGDLADTFLTVRNSGVEKLEPDQLKLFNLWQRASRNDPAALREYLKTLMPPETPTGTTESPATVPNTELEQVKGMMAELKKLLEGDVLPVTRNIRELTLNNQIGAAIQGKAQEFPLLAKLLKQRSNQAAVLVRGRQKYYAEMLKQSNRNFESLMPDQQQKVWTQAMKDIETQLADFKSVFSPAQISSGTPPLLDDQGTNAAADESRVLARYTIDPVTGRVVDRHAKIPAGSNPPTVPNLPVTPVPAGRTVGTDAVQDNSGPFTEGKLRQFLKAKISSMEGVV